MPDGGTIVGGISKLTIRAFSDAACQKSAGGEPIVVPINPESYSQKLGVAYTPDEAAGSSGRSKVLHRELGESLTLVLILDGTGAVPGIARTTVTQQVQDLRRIGLALNAKGQTNYLTVSWGALYFKCRMLSLDLVYTLFNPDGTPLRAKATVTFDAVAPSDSSSKGASAAPALKSVVVTGGDDLSSLCDSIYGDPSYAIDVASANDLDGFRSLAPGQLLHFPALTGSDS